MRRMLLAGMLALGVMGRGLGQDQRRDSLRQVVARPPTSDTLRVAAYYQYGEYFELDQPDTAAHYYRLGRQLAERMGFARGVATYASYQIVLLNNQGRYAEALALCREALAIYQQQGTPRDQAVAYLNLGNEWQYLGDYPLAAESYLKAQQLSEKMGNQPFLRITNNNLASVFLDLKDYPKAKQYARKARTIAQALQNDYGQASSLVNLAAAHQALGELDSAAVYFAEVGRLGQKTEDYVLQLDALTGQGGVWLDRQQPAQAQTVFTNMLALAQAQDNPPYQLVAYKGLAKSYLATGQARFAQQAIDQGLALATQMGEKLDRRELCRLGAALAEKEQRWAAALAYRKQETAMTDSLAQEKALASVNLAEAKYEAGRKAEQIAQLEREKRTQKQLNYLAGGVIAALLLAGFFGYRYYRQRQKLAQQTQVLLAQQVRELEQEKQLLAVDAVLRGQEQERNRLAKDLHDGLGGLLSGVKLTLHNFLSDNVMNGTQLLSEESARGLLRAIDLLDTSIAELRRVARDLMPEALARFGLAEALRDFCANLAQASGITIDYQVFGLEARLPATTETVVFRLVQELLNNTVKHAQARQALVQLVRDGSRLSLTVEDDGQGFDPAQLKTASGIGWANLRSRVEYLGGTLDLQTAPAKARRCILSCR
ncbi:MAG: tetratricopeptide repeat protein [Bernardetiaceae bacterium]|nr:tetratricopeptide repeat protein [Bernardetiaceae bacterium]